MTPTDDHSGSDHKVQQGSGASDLFLQKLLASFQHTSKSPGKSNPFGLNHPNVPPRSSMIAELLTPSHLQCAPETFAAVWNTVGIKIGTCS